MNPSSPSLPEFLVIIDPAHGGEERGAALNDHLAEKDVALGFARRLRYELEVRGIAARLLRDHDTALTAEERAVAANSAAGPYLSAAGSGTATAIFISIHASDIGSGVRLFTSTLPPARSAPAFLPWKTAQAAFVARSGLLATALATELLKHDVPAVSLVSSVPPLDNIASPALAVELAPPHGRIEDLNSAAYQQSIAAILADAIRACRSRLTAQSGQVRSR